MAVIENLTTWAAKSAEQRKERDEYLQNPPQFSDLWMKRALLAAALKPIAARYRGDTVDPMKSKGANMEVYDFVAGDLEELLREWLSARCEIDDALAARLHTFASYIARRFVFKIGNLDDFIVKFGPKTSKFPRADMHRAFAPLGYPLLHEMLRVRKLAREVIRSNVYFGNEEEVPITGPYLFEEIRRFLNDPCGYEPADTSQNFVVADYADEETDDEREKHDVVDFCEGARDYAGCRALNKAARSPQVSDYRAVLQPPLDSVVTIGAHDTVRRVTGFDRQRPLGYEEAAGLIEEQCAKHQADSFLVPEQTTYGYSPSVTAEKWREHQANNELAAKLFANYFWEKLPESLRPIFQDQNVVLEFCFHTMEHFNSVPEYDVDPTSTVFSVTMLRFLFKAAYLYCARPGCEKRTDFEKEPCLSRFFAELDNRDVVKLQQVVSRCLKRYSRVQKEGLAPEFICYERQKTQAKTQDRLDYDGENEVVAGPFSIRELINERRDLFEKYPEIAEKLLVLYYQIFKMYQDTGYLPDMRPENVVKYVFMMGEWGVQTENVQITIFKDAHGREYVKVVDIDPEDHFRKAPQRMADRDSGEGLATYGFNLIEPCSRSITKAIARFADEVAGGDGIKKCLPPPAWLTHWVFDFLREGGSKARNFLKIAYRAVREEIIERLNKVGRKG